MSDFTDIRHFTQSTTFPHSQTKTRRNRGKNECEQQKKRGKKRHKKGGE